LFGWLESYYVDSVNLDQLTDHAIREILHKLDPHSTYITKDEAKAMNEPLEGNFEGIGITFNIYKDTILIISAINGGPAEKLGILAGDRIIKIDSANVAGIGINSRQVMGKLKGPKGTKVTVRIIRRNDPDTYDYVITRDKIPIHSVDASYKVDAKTGYIKLSRFSQITMSEILPLLQKFREDSITNLIVDLSGNGGGVLPVSLSLADEFLEEGKEIVFTKGLNSEQIDYKATNQGNFEKGNLIVIMDEGSASASEIFAGAIQDWDRGIIIGRRSFGKGLVQRRFIFPDESELRLTIARYYTPSGRLIQKSYAEGYNVYENELNNRVESGEIFDANSKDLKVDTTLKYYTLLRKRPVYGGGGIIPDILVPLDTTSHNNLYRNVIGKGLMTNFVLDFIDNNRGLLNRKYPNFQIFLKNFIVDGQLIGDFKKYLKIKQISFNDSEFDQNKNPFQILIKAYIANNLWTSSEFYQVYNEMDPCYLKAVDVINNRDSNFSHF
jgi:carboxyl-terminal processing protease